MTERRMGVRASLDGDRVWLDWQGRSVAFVRMAHFESLIAPSDFGPQELIPVVGERSPALGAET